MALALKITDTLIIVPYSEDAILAACNEVFSLVSYTDGIQLFLGALDGSDYLPVVFLPVGDFSIGTHSDNLVFLRV